jgi:hypothetical protein
MKDRVRYAIALVIGFMLVNIVCGIFRKPVNMVYMSQLSEQYQNIKNPGKWTLSEPTVINYGIGVIGTYVSFHNDNELYEFSVIRYLNILPDLVPDPVMTGKVHVY